MTYLVYFLLFALVLGLVGVASNPSPYFASLGLVCVAVIGGILVAHHGGCFLSLVLSLIYLGGMLVVFAYSAALAAEPYPEGWGSRSVLGPMLTYLAVVGVACGFLSKEWYSDSFMMLEELLEFSVLRGDTGGVAVMYSGGGWLLVIGAWVLLLTLFVVLELTRGVSRGALRAV